MADSPTAIDAREREAGPVEQQPAARVLDLGALLLCTARVALRVEAERAQQVVGLVARVVLGRPGVKALVVAFARHIVTLSVSIVNVCTMARRQSPA